MALAVVIAAGAVGAFFATRSGGPSPSRNRSPAQKEVYGTFGAFGVSYGTSARQLFARLGAPDQKQGSCWMYRIRGGRFNGIKLLPQIAGMDAVRYCFYSGVIATIEDHWHPPHPVGKAWLPPLTFGCGGGPCHAAQ